MGTIYIYNKHIAPITVNARNGKGAVLFTKTFQPERIDGTTGRIVSTGYTALTGEEYDRLSGSSRTFTHYMSKLGLLEKCDDLPPEAKTPQEALVDARNKTKAAQARVSELEAEIEKLKVGLHDANEKIGQLVSASTQQEALKLLEDKIALLEKDKDTLKKENEAMKAVLEKGGKGGKGKEKEFA
jgi:chromosome segregation ATPase